MTVGRVVVSLAAGVFVAGSVVAALELAESRWPILSRATSEGVRWTRWATRCRRGARCATLVTNHLVAEPGTVLRLTYRCEGCGTVYVVETMAVGDGTWIEATEPVPRARP